MGLSAHRVNVREESLDRKRATIADVAALAKVDRGLVSKVLNNKTGFSIRESTRQRVRLAAEELNYHPSVAARSLRTSKTGSIGVLIPTFMNPIWSTILDSAEAEADRRGYTLLAGIAGNDPLTGDSRPSRFLDLARSGSVDGLLVASAIEDTELRLGFGDIPWLHINRRPDESRRHLLLDDEAGLTHATRHLIDLGHRRIGYLSGPLDTDSGRRRLRGFQTAMDSLGENRTLLVEASYELDSGARAFREIINTAPELTGVVCASFASAAGALAAAHEMRIDIPYRLSMIALHDVALAGSFGPPLTTVKMPLDELGSRSIELLLDHDPLADIDEMITSPIALIQRTSTAAPADNF